jgi:hypothetical protein
MAGCSKLSSSKAAAEHETEAYSEYVEVREATNKSPHACARARDSERPVS